MSRHDLVICWTVIHFSDLIFVFGVSSVLQNLSRALQTIPSHSSQCLCRTTLLAAISKIISVAQTSFSILRRDRSNLLVKTSNNLKTLLGVNHFYGVYLSGAYFSNKANFFRPLVFLLPNFRSLIFQGKFQTSSQGLFGTPLNFSRKFFRPLKTALDCFFFLYVHEFFLYISEFFLYCTVFYGRCAKYIYVFHAFLCMQEKT